MTEDEKKRAICQAAEGKQVGILCLNVDTMRNMAMRIREAAKDYAEGNQWKVTGEWVAFPESGGMVKVFVRSHSTTFDALYLDPMMADAEARLMDARIAVRPKP